MPPTGPQRIDTSGDVKHKPATSMASISAHIQFVFRVNPYNIGWGYNLRTHVDDTYGGKIIQILGVDLTSLTIDTVAGKAGIKYVQEFATFWRDMCQWQQQDPQRVATFSFPAKNYSLKVWAQALTFNNTVGNVVYPINMTFQIQEDLAGTLKKTAMTDTLKKMAVGIGYTRNDYNYPSASSEQDYHSKIAAAIAASGAEVVGGTTPGNLTAVNGTDASINANQQANAQAIIGVALGLFSGLDGKLASIIGVMAALAESEMTVINYGDSPGGVPSSSRGLFQQLSAWGPLADRMDPIKSATMFFTHGQAGQHGLQEITGWQGLAPWAAAQAVQQSEFADGSNYHARYQKAVSIVDAILSSNSTTKAQASGTGVSVTIPNKPDVLDASIRGATIMAPTPAVANGIIQGLSYIGTPYVYGGGDGLGSGPDHGSRDSPPNTNPLIGFDCSGLVGFVIKHMGFTPGGSYSTPQNAGGQQIPYADTLPGDVIGYSGHTTISLGKINGTNYLLEAPETGKNVQVKAVYDTNEGIPRFPNVARYWI